MGGRGKTDQPVIISNSVVTFCKQGVISASFQASGRVEEFLNDLLNKIDNGTLFTIRY